MSTEDTLSPARLMAVIHQMGGPTFVANQLNISTATVHGWIKLVRVPSMSKRLELRALALRVKADI